MTMVLVNCVVICVILCHHFGDVTCDANRLDLTQHPGHLKKYGSQGRFKRVEEVDSSPSTVDFFENYVAPSQPLVMRGVLKDSKPYREWTDEYFLSLPYTQNYKVQVQNKINPTIMNKVDFREFVRTYKETNDYLEDYVMTGLRQEVPLPLPLQCEEVGHRYHSAHLWFNNGGTKSVVHTDGADNILCLYDGQKEVTLLDPDQYINKVGFRPVMVAVAGIDVDRVDYTKHPDLANIEFYHKANLTAGDCLYIPYNWIHQVYSYNRNVAVNIWWHRTDDVTHITSRCKDNLRSPVTLQDMYVLRRKAPITPMEEFVTFLNDITIGKPVALADFYRYLVKKFVAGIYYVNIFTDPDDDVEPISFGLFSEDFFESLIQHPDVRANYDSEVKPMIIEMDHNNDGMLSKAEVTFTAEHILGDLHNKVAMFKRIIVRLKAGLLKTTENHSSAQEPPGNTLTEDDHQHSEL